MMHFFEAQGMVKGGRSYTRYGDGRKLQNHTYVIRLDQEKGEAYGILLHDTIVVFIYENGLYRLNHGAYRTMTTRNRINDYAPGTVYSIRGNWYFSPRHGIRDTLLYSFFNNMLVDIEGFLVSKVDEEYRCPHCNEPRADLVDDVEIEPPVKRFLEV
jgi:hypothetical protein